LFPELAGYRIEHIEIVAAFDIDERKTGQDLGAAIFAEPNCTQVFFNDVPKMGVSVCRGPSLDGASAHMRQQPSDRSFRESSVKEFSEDGVVKQLIETRTEVVISFLPVGSQSASEFYATCALKAGAAFVNAIPVFLASNQKWASAFERAGLPILGDDFKAQIGATVLHRALANLFKIRGAQLDRTYQLNIGGNTDFLNMMDDQRLESKRTSKTEAVQAAVSSRLNDEDVRIGPSDYVPWLNDQKVAYIRLEGRLFGGVQVNLETRLSVEDSPNAAAMALAAIRCARIARDRNLAGAIWEPSAFLFKHPPRQLEDHEAHELLLRFCTNGSEAVV
jgi:myo-inositol-1-phosphate synthase